MSKDLQRVECSCPECSSWCERLPGWFVPGEAEKAAELKGLTLEDFFERFLQVDYWVGDPNIYVLRPAVVGSAPGEMVAADPKGRCAFYVDGKCEIHAAKPHECATAKHDVDLPSDWHKQTAIAWKDHQQQIVNLLGHEPYAEEPSLLDMFSMLMR